MRQSQISTLEMRQSQTVKERSTAETETSDLTLAETSDLTQAEREAFENLKDQVSFSRFQLIMKTLPVNSIFSFLFADIPR
jgi:DTW domain-containing protein YfiP